MPNLTPVNPKLLQGLPEDFRDWLRQLQVVIGNIADGTIDWTDVSKTGSNLNEIVTRNHSDTQNKQGGQLGEYYHLREVDYLDLTGHGDSNLHWHSSDRSAANFTGTDWTTWGSWTPTRTGWTDIGAAPTVTARYNQTNGVVKFQVKVVPGTTTATVAGTSYINLPVTAGASGLAGDGSMMNLTTLVGIGICTLDYTNSRCYVPAQAATGNTLTIAGWYEA